MRNLIWLSLVLAGVSFFGQRQARAAEYPFCMSYMGGWGSGLIENCSYLTFEQCQIGTGGISGQCYANWRLSWARNQEVIIDNPRSVRTKRRY